MLNVDSADFSQFSIFIFRSGKLRVKVEKKEGYLCVDEIKSDVQLAGAFHEVRIFASMKGLSE